MLVLQKFNKVKQGRRNDKQWVAKLELRLGVTCKSANDSFATT